MAQSPALDDQYREGIFYDMAGCDFCRIIETEDSIGLVEPDNPDGDPFHEYDNPEDFDPVDFVKVPEKAVENPAHYLQRRVDVMASMDPLEQFSASEEFGIRYANRNTEIVELD